MRKFHLATIIAIVITTSIASHVLAIGSLGAGTPGFLKSARPRFARFCRRLGILVNGWIAAALADREKQAANFPLRHLAGLEPHHVGFDRDLAVGEKKASAADIVKVRP